MLYRAVSLPSTLPCSEQRIAQHCCAAGFQSGLGRIRVRLGPLCIVDDTGKVEREKVASEPEALLTY